MLEMFRLVHYRAVAASQYPGFVKFPLSLRDSARALAAPMLGDEELQKRLAGALDSQVHSVRFERFAEPEYVVMLALFNVCHLALYYVFVRNVADETNNILRQSGEARCYSPKMVGQILNKSLGFSTRRQGDGYRIALTLDVRKKIHSQAKAMGLNRSDSFPSINIECRVVDKRCSHCSEFGLMTDHEGWSLRPHTELGGPFIRCTNCGAGLYSDDEQCRHCDTPRQADTAEPSREPASSRSP